MTTHEEKKTKARQAKKGIRFPPVIITKYKCLNCGLFSNKERFEQEYEPELMIQEFAGRGKITVIERKKPNNNKEYPGGNKQ